MSKVLVVSPHPDDELLGCGGTLLRRKVEGAELAWMILTGISEDLGWTKEQVRQREQEIEAVQKGLGVDHLFNMRFPTTKLDTIPMVELIQQVSKVFHKFQPEELFLPFWGDVHSDHRITFEALSACTKWYRFPFLKRSLAYQTLSETDFVIKNNEIFHPNYFIDISKYVEKKIELLYIYKTEFLNYPFPRSEKGIRALSEINGLKSGFEAAEAFMLLKETC